MSSLPINDAQNNLQELIDLLSIPGMKESIKEGLVTSIDELNK